MYSGLGLGISEAIQLHLHKYIMISFDNLFLKQAPFSLSYYLMLILSYRYIVLIITRPEIICG